MRLKELKQLELPASADMHVHLRQGKLMDLVAPQVRRGGVDTVFVMVKYTRSIVIFTIYSLNLAQSHTPCYDGPSRC
jgi:dihydroorotase